MKPQRGLQWGLHQSQGTEGAWQKHWWKWTGGEDAANADAKLGGQSNALRLECSRKGPAVAVGTPALAVPCLEAGIEGSSPARCKGRGGEEEKREAGGPCACLLPRQVGFSNRAPLTGSI